jgi:hypothetical protein
VEIVFRVKTMDGEFEFQVDLPRFTVGATNESDFNDGEPLANFLILDAPIIDETVPAVSTWGLITLSLLLLVGSSSLAHVAMEKRQKPTLSPPPCVVGRRSFNGNFSSCSVHGS